jgi:hypothetical protein
VFDRRCFSSEGVDVSYLLPAGNAPHQLDILLAHSFRLVNRHGLAGKHDLVLAHQVFV